MWKVQNQPSSQWSWRQTCTSQSSWKLYFYHVFVVAEFCCTFQSWIVWVTCFCSLWVCVFFFTLCVRATLAVRVQFACGVEAPLEACYILYICLFKNQSLRWALLGINWGFVLCVWSTVLMIYLRVLLLLLLMYQKQKQCLWANIQNQCYALRVVAT